MYYNITYNYKIYQLLIFNLFFPILPTSIQTYFIFFFTLYLNY